MKINRKLAISLFSNVLNLEISKMPTRAIMNNAENLSEIVSAKRKAEKTIQNQLISFFSATKK
tara:strand:+ start:284 stop:472 length:189 start_codon:yes stop_codon:yes gene_type:complete